MKDEFIDIFANIEQDLDRAAQEARKLVRSYNEVVELSDNSGWYQIEFSRCDSHQKLVQWIYHLSAKPWVTPRHIRLFLSHVFSHFPDLAPHDPLA